MEMTTQPVFNALTYIDRLTAGGVSPEQARSMAEALEQALQESVATKSDIESIKNKIDLVARDIKLWAGSIAAASVVILIGVKYFS